MKKLVIILALIFASASPLAFAKVKGVKSRDSIKPTPSTSSPCWTPSPEPTGDLNNIL